MIKYEFDNKVLSVNWLKSYKMIKQSRNRSNTKIIKNYLFRYIKVS